MKNFIYVAVCTALGFSAVSCDTDSVEGIANGYANKNSKDEVSNVTLKETDTIPTDTLTINLLTGPGPGDDVVPIKPPKP
ncbi:MULTISPECIES: hypothetical protein [Flavobacterium]|uniref:Uncharacterized protein n=1 Tax=Flavobacterium hankyongi TaxID=1176532 RepID=A0ABP9A0L4_9FLAO|nr:hypothetical protein [Flavobacterium sp. N1846]